MNHEKLRKHRGSSYLDKTTKGVWFSSCIPEFVSSFIKSSHPSLASSELIKYFTDLLGISVHVRPAL